MIGGGKYDDVATYVREQTNAQGVIVIVIDANDGAGFSVQLPPSLFPLIPEMLESVAREIRADLKGVPPNQQN